VERGQLVPEALVLHRVGDPAALPAIREGRATPQDQASQAVVHYVMDIAAVSDAPERILDVAAAPGGKATGMAARAGRGTVVAADLHHGRLRLVQQAARRLGLRNVAPWWPTAPSRRSPPAASIGCWSMHRAAASACCGAGPMPVRLDPDRDRHVGALQRRLVVRAATLVRPEACSSTRCAHSPPRRRWRWWPPFATSSQGWCRFPHRTLRGGGEVTGAAAPAGRGDRWDVHRRVATAGLASRADDPEARTFDPVRRLLVPGRRGRARRRRGRSTARRRDGRAFRPQPHDRPPVVASLRARTNLFLDCHLMVDNPGDLLEDFVAAGADRCIVHVELGIHDRTSTSCGGGARVSVSRSIRGPRWRPCCRISRRWISCSS